MSSYVLFLLIWFVEISGISCDHSDPCKTGDTGIYPHPEECQLYYNCSLPQDKFKPWLGDHVMECMYPDLFRIRTLRCEAFENVRCRKRQRYDHACEYLNNLCGELDCSPCRSDFSCSDITGSASNPQTGSCDYTSTELLKKLTCPHDEQGNMKILDASICSSVK